MNSTQKFELVWPTLKTLNNEFGDRYGNGDFEKVLAMVILGMGSFIAGLLPAFITERNRQRFPLLTSLILCFGAGILLATAIVHILPEVRKQMSSNWAEISLGVGFFIIYFIDEFIHYFFGEAIQHSHSNGRHSQNNTSSNNHHNNYGSFHSSESQPLILGTQNNSILTNDESQNHNHHAHQHNNEGSDHNHDENLEQVHCSDEIVAVANARICHTSHSGPCSQSMTGTLGLFAAMSLHSAIEGLAIGVQNSSAKVLFLLGAVACHKFVMGFCLGLQFRSNPQTSLKSHIIGISVFAFGAICGIGVGMIIVDIPSSWSTATLPIIQGLAGGTLLYVTVCEVIPREKAAWHMSPRKFACFAQFILVAVGFAVMSTLNFYFDDDT